MASEGSYFSLKTSCSDSPVASAGKGDMVLDSEVVLTKMKLFDNFHGRLCGAEDSVSTISISVSEQDLSEPGQVSDGDPNLCPSEQAPSDPKPDYLSVFSDPQLPRLYKFESEDSGVEMPSGADSPSTPTGSEQSFVVHSRAPSRDSQDLGTDVAAPGPILQSEKCPATEETKTPLHPVTKEEGNDFGTLETKTNLEVMQVHISPMEENMTMKGPQDGLLEDTSEDCENSIVMKVATEELAEQSTTIRNCNSTEALNMTEADLQPQPLRKSTTSDSLDEYMEECCRLSEVHRAKINPLGPSLGYLEHICQLIEKIGQLQEHNLRLQRQLSSLQKENRTKNTKEKCLTVRRYLRCASGQECRSWTLSAGHRGRDNSKSPLWRRTWEPRPLSSSLVRPASVPAQRVARTRLSGTHVVFADYLVLPTADRLPLDCRVDSPQLLCTVSAPSSGMNIPLAPLAVSLHLSSLGHLSAKDVGKLPCLAPCHMPSPLLHL
ncbi:hypothetical protein Z043_110502 [Scleropages formosus]|uniref:DUF4657 domain-containing protein n=1 Tax=Scleropages formosus TaxID=113540 RepID=A0A0P7V708_SCLFO|nr:hypothetical protein Z043_110502 [Scleropages formosus]